jgi:signal transduction histidine kinase
VYFRYDEVVQRSGQLWVGFAGITIGSILLVVLLLLPVLARLLRALQGARRHREALLERALEASGDERRRIAGALHDGVVQDLVATSLAVSAESAASRRRGDAATADGLDAVAATVRGSVGALRSLLVDIYPASLAASGLEPALVDLAQAATARGVPVRLDVDPETAEALSADDQRLVFRVVQESLVNVVAHARASSCVVTVEARPGGRGAVATIADDGVGLDPGLLDRPDQAHFGLRVLRDLAAGAGATLELATAAGRGTRWRLTTEVS